MSDSLVDLFATDAQLDLIGSRQRDASADLVLASLAMLADAVDMAPLPPVALPACRSTPMLSARKGSWALAVTVAMMVTSSGVAEAVSDSPFGPLRYVTNQVWRLGPPPNHHRIPGWTLNGAERISTGLGVGNSGGGASVSGTGAGAGPVVSETAGSAVGTPDAHRVGRSRDSDSGRVPTREGHGGHVPSTGSGSGHGTGGSGEPPVTNPPGDNGGSGSGPGSVGNVREPNSPTGGETPGSPHGPAPGQQGNGSLGESDYGRVPSTGTGSHARGHCRVEGPTKATEPGGGGGGHQTCDEGTTKPRPHESPNRSLPPAPPTPKLPTPKADPPTSTSEAPDLTPGVASETGKG